MTARQPPSLHRERPPDMATRLTTVLVALHRRGPILPVRLLLSRTVR